ncbi:SMC-Scp complex subunit ScpB [Thermosulfurimonas dismutans]|uniref:Segregation and condensation protein B n=1 Tax=Thermosulfurimonas dismutans TaxID=999894 RepID=A0A179D636_9BACT|nr:SMC-Scp complex subunit ScpB [Thermosulfurimonas dismutans]OAQ21565.1 Segregation and condensation protein B [Thermosulfurimonas dismutans]
MTNGLIKKALEAILLASGKTIKLKELKVLFPEVPEEDLRNLLYELALEYQGRGIRIREVAGGFRMETVPEVSEYVRAYLKPKPQRLSRAALETLAVIAYYQPITRAEIERMRGVDASASLKILLERELIRVVGRKEVPGRPLLYGTTEKFLEVFGLKDLRDLPPLEELKRLSGRA